MNRITSFQLLSLMLLQSIWEVICIPALPGSGLLTGALCAYLVQMLLLIPLLSEKPGLFRQKWIGLVFAGYFLLTGARNLCQISGAAPAILPTVPEKWAAASLLLVTCLYTSAAGIKAAARCAPLTLGLLVLSLLILAAGAWQHIVPERFYWSRDGLREGGAVFFTSAELPMLWVLLRRVEGSPRRTVLGYTLARTGFLALIVFLLITAGGRLAQSADYPFFTLTALSQPLQGQRADALYILLFVMLCVMQVTMQAGLTAHLLEELFPKLRHTAPAVLPAMLGLSGILGFRTLDGLAAMLLPVLAFGLPCTLLLLAGLKRRAAA